MSDIAMQQTEMTRDEEIIHAITSLGFYTQVTQYPWFYTDRDIFIPPLTLWPERVQ